VATSRIVICDDHEIVREALRARIESIPGFEVVGEAADGRKVIDLVRRTRPDLLIIDVELPGSDGISASIRILELWPDQKILVFTAHDQASVCDLVAQAGVHGCVSKAASTSEIENAVRAVLGGETWFETCAGQIAGEGDELKRLRSLSEREFEILNLLAAGMRASDIAEVTGIRKATVYTHVRNVVTKLGVQTRAQAVGMAIQYAFLNPTDAPVRPFKPARGTPASSR